MIGMKKIRCCLFFHGVNTAGPLFRNTGCPSFKKNSENLLPLTSFFPSNTVQGEREKIKVKKELQKMVARSVKAAGKLLIDLAKVILALPVLILAVFFSGNDNQQLNRFFKGKNETWSTFKKTKIELKKKGNGFGFFFSRETRVNGETKNSGETGNSKPPELEG